MKRIKTILAILPLLGSVWTAVAQPQRTAVQTDLERGIYFFEHGQFETAIRHLEAFKGGPAHDLNERADFYLTLARSYSDSVNVALYFEAYTRTYPASSHTTELLLEAAQRFNLSGRHKTALYYYKKLLDRELRPADEARIRYWAAESKLSQGDTTQAIADLLFVADKFPKTDLAPKALYSRGRLHLARRELSDAAPAFELLRSRFPNHELTRRIGSALGETYYQQARYNDAIKAFTESMPYLDEEQKARTVFLIGECHNMTGNLEEAATFYLRYINLKKNSDVRDAHFGLGWVYNRQKIYHWAAESFAKAATGTDELAQKGLYYQAVNEKLAGRYDKALKTFAAFSTRFTSGPWLERATYEWAYAALEYGDYEMAIETAQKLLKTPKSLREPGRMYQLLGEAYFANGEYTRAHQAFEQAEKSVTLPPDAKYTARFQRAWLLYQNNAYDQAQTAFYRLWSENQKHPKAPEALFWSADAYFSMDDITSAAAQFDLFLKTYPRHRFAGAAYYSLGWSYFRSRDYDKAVEAFEAFLKDYKPPPVALFPYDIDTRLRIGDARYAMADYEAALTAYEAVADGEDGADYALYQMANSYYRSGRSYEAVTTFRELLERFPESRLREQALYNIAYVYFLMGNYDQAVAEFNRLISLYPGSQWSARSQYNIGDAYYNAKQYPQALNAYRSVLTGFPDSDYVIEAVNGIQYTQLASGGADSSSAVLEKFLAANPKSFTADRLKYRQAEQKLQSGDYDGAIAAFRDYLRVTNVERMIPEALYNLADAYAQAGRDADAQRTWTEIVDRHPKSEKAEPALVARARTEMKLKNYPAARASYQKLRDLNGRFVLEAWIGLGSIALSENRLDDARTAFNRAVAISPKSDAGRLGLARLDVTLKRWEPAMTALSRLTASAAGEVAAEAQYWSGVVLAGQNRDEEAIQAFLKTKVLFESHTEWVAASLLDAARIHVKLSQPGPAALLLRQIQDLYPAAPAAEPAAALLKSLSQ